MFLICILGYQSQGHMQITEFYDLERILDGPIMWPMAPWMSHVTFSSFAFHHSLSFLLNHALLQGCKEAISRTDMDCQVRAASIRPGQDDQYALICLQINDSDKNSHQRKPWKETWDVVAIRDLIPKPPGQAGCTGGYMLKMEVQLPEEQYAWILVSHHIFSNICAYSCIILVRGLWESLLVMVLTHKSLSENKTRHEWRPLSPRYFITHSLPEL